MVQSGEVLGSNHVFFCIGKALELHNLLPKL
jgi:hypothetical protein